MLREKSYTLRDHRRRALLTGTEVARRLGVHSNTVYGWERGRCRPNPAAVRRLARLYQIPRETVLASLPEPM